MSIWLKLPLMFWILLGISVCFQICAVILQYFLVVEVNRSAPEEETLSFFFGYPGVYSTQIKKHKQLFPTSRKRKLLVFFNALAIAFFLTAWFVSGFFSPDFFDEP